jgi:WD40 repeat protein
MEDPVLGLCGHLFDKSVLSKIFECPIDQTSLHDTIPCKELRERIQDWNLDPPEDNGSPSHSLNESKVEPEEQKQIEYTRIFECAHRDNIYGLLRINSKHFISCSKDGTIKKWTNDGVLVKTLRPHPTGEASWITSLALFNNGYWASGALDGTISFWNKKDFESFTINYPADHKSHPSTRNRRINCVAEAETFKNGSSFYAGTPQYLQLWDSRDGKMLEKYKASDREWVYCVEVLENKNLLVAVGSDLEYWNMEKADPRREHVLNEVKTEEHHPRISSLIRLEKERNLAGCSLFDGSVKVIDFVTNKLCNQFNEHKGRVWSVININLSCLASGADDKTVKLWDLRTQKSVMSLDDHPGRVSCILKTSEYSIVSGSCPEDPSRTKEKATLTYWDIRSALSRPLTG